MERMEIPKQLNFCRFNRVRFKDKRAFEPNWQNNPYTYEQIKQFFPQENYGVICGKEVRVLDDDTPDKRLIKLFTEHFGETFRVRDHLYFAFENQHDKKIILFEDGIHLGEIQGEGTYVVGPGCTHPSGDIYEIKNKAAIQFIFYEEFEKVFGKYMARSQPIQRTEIELNNDDLKIIDQFKEQWKVGDRQNLTLSLAGYLRKNKGFGFERVRGIIEKICEEMQDSDLNERLKAVQETFMKDENIIKGLSGLQERNIVKDYSALRAKIFEYLSDKKRDLATECIVKEIEDNNYIYTTRDDVKSEMWIYKEGIYVPQGKSFIREYCRTILRSSYTTSFVNAVIAKIESDTFIEQEDFFGTNYTYEIPLINGILNIKTKELTDHTPDKIFFNKLPICYDPESTCPNILKHFNNILHSKEDVQVLLEIFGYLLLKEYKIEKAFMFIGFGRNGKSKTIELMKQFLGANNCSSVPLRSLHEESFSLSELFGKMANLAADLSRTDLKETGMIKSLIGRDTIQAHRKFLRDLNFVNYAKLCFAANELPRIYDTTDGFWTKWVLLEFPYKFVTQQQYDNTPENERKNLKIKDDDIIKKLITGQELSGLLNEALKALDTLLEQKDFSYSKSTSEVKDLWIRKSDSFTAFCSDHIQEDLEIKIPKKVLRKVYHRYTKKHKVPGCSDKAIKVTLEALFGVTDTQDSDFNRLWEGISFKNLGEEYQNLIN